MPRKREIKVKLSRPLVIPDAAFKLLAEEFVEWYEREGYKRELAKQDQSEKDKDTEKQSKE